MLTQSWPVGDKNRFDDLGHPRRALYNNTECKASTMGRV